MSSIPAANPGVSSSGASSVLQFLSSAASPLVSSVISSASVQSALESASPADLIQLSAQALRYQEAEGLFAFGHGGSERGFRFLHAQPACQLSEPDEPDAGRDAAGNGGCID